MEVKIFRRHSADCPDKADRYASLCGCPLPYQYGNVFTIEQFGSALWTIVSEGGVR
jgi:hypothetical protein